MIYNLKYFYFNPIDGKWSSKEARLYPMVVVVVEQDGSIDNLEMMMIINALVVVIFRFQNILTLAVPCARHWLQPENIKMIDLSIK